jgi:hypothetical protein
LIVSEIKEKATGLERQIIRYDISTAIATCNNVNVVIYVYCIICGVFYMHAISNKFMYKIKLTSLAKILIKIDQLENT